MKPTILIADDVGASSSELATVFKGRGVHLDRATSLEECVDKARAVAPEIIFVYAGMNRAFSLLRILRRSDDLAAVPLVVVAEPDQEELIAKHRRLPSRADRYLLRPLDPEMTRSAVSEYLAGDEATQAETVWDEKTPPPLPKGTNGLVEAPDAFARAEEEIHNYRTRIKELEKDVRSLLKVTAENATLREEVISLRQRIQENSGESGSTAEEYNELFQRLESGYKETIDDMERLIQEKDDIIARLAQSGGGGGGDDGALAEQLEQEQARHGELMKGLRQMLTVLQGMARTEEELEIDSLVARAAAEGEEQEEFHSGFSFDEKTLVVEADEIRKRLDSD